VSLALAGWIQFGARVIAGSAFFLALLVALTHWAVRAKHLGAFGAWPRFIRGWSDPLLKPLERRIVRSGGNPQDAAFWLVGLAVLLGLALIAAVQWLIGFVYQTMALADGGGIVIALTLVHYGFSILIAALFVTVIASWLNISPYGRIMRIANGLTSWLLDPIRRVLPPFGMFDMSPLVAYFLLYFAERALIGLML
jgi:YggT family protein